MTKYDFFLIYLVAINLAGAYVLYFDKQLAYRKSVARIPEFYFYSLSVLGSVFGILMGIYLMPHKKNNEKFCLFTNIIFVLWVVVLILLALKW